MISMIELGREMLGTIRRNATHDYPLECCGILIGAARNDCLTVQRVVQAENISDGDRRQSYQIDWQSLFRAVKAVRGSSGRTIGFYHSHPDGSLTPSQSDLELAWRECAYLIVPVADGKTGDPSAWFLPDGQSRFAPVEVSIVE